LHQIFAELSAKTLHGRIRLLSLGAGSLDCSGSLGKRIRILIGLFNLQTASNFAGCFRNMF
jgi:hypothetical protein